MDPSVYPLGIDVGSTTAKLVLLDPHGGVAYAAYRRHNAEPLATLRALLAEAQAGLGAVSVCPLLTGSAGLGLSEKLELPFLQEIIAAAEVVRRLYPQARTLLDIGGEDAKLIFFDPGSAPDIRMNGACAGGTGAFIDQMATLLNVPVEALSPLAEQHTVDYAIASRCGVFAKTDVQNLLSRDARREDIAAAIFQAVVWQTLATLARGRTPLPVVLFAGGPLTFLPALKAAFVSALKLGPGDWLDVERPELIPARGAALAAAGRSSAMPLPALLERLSAERPTPALSGRLRPLFGAEHPYGAWSAARTQHRVPQVKAEAVAGGECFLGIDSGSTTTKLALIDGQGRLFFDDYSANHGNAIQAVQAALGRLSQRLAGLARPPRIVRSAVTGYGEDLIRAAFGCDEGLVETLAHYRAARAFDPQVSFVLDIGGQDMKAIFVRDGHIQRIEINEACSSGCGTFVEGFAQSLGRTVGDFALEACQAGAPCDLGTRCTVFMNSRVKQALRERAPVADIAAGLAYSVIKNALHKVLKLTDTGVLGDHIVVQGGAFRNPAIHRALEAVLGRPVICPDKAELMGAYGAALAARDAYRRVGQGRGLGLRPEDVAAAGRYRQQTIHCRGCENRCTVSKLTFPNQNVFYTGNRCERTYSNRGRRVVRGANLYARKRDLLFDRPAPAGEAAEAPALTIGLPRALNFYEDYPFWHTLFVEAGFAVRLSAPSTSAVFQKGAGSVMSENICFPAKLLHGHVMDLIEAGVDRIFYPMVFYAKREFADAINCFNCPVVSGYPDVVRSAIDPAGRHGVPFDQPAITFNDPVLLKQSCAEYLGGLGVPAERIERAFQRALKAQADYRERVVALGAEILAEARAAGRRVVVLAGRPYHADPLVNHGIPEALADMGVDVISEDAVPLARGERLEDVQVMTQWTYLNRYYHAARWVGGQADVELVQLNSFGCGPDAFAIDEIRDLLAARGKNHTVIRIDEIDSLGSARLRLRSMLEALDEAGGQPAPRRARRTTRVFAPADRRKTLLVPEFSPFCSPPIIRPVADQGYRVEVLPHSDRESVDAGLKYTNNEICYPGIIVIGDAIKALQSGRYDPAEVIVGSWETGGQCRASNISCLLKKALVAAGFADVPVVTLSTKLKSLNPQPDFKLNIPKYLYQALLGMAFTDGLSAMYHSSAVRERLPGSALAVAQKYLIPFQDGRMPLRPRVVLDTLRQAVTEFNALEAVAGHLPQVGVVGEIYVKYNTFVNNDVVQWLMGQGLEVHLPPLLAFFMGSFVGYKAGVQARIRRPDWLWWLTQATHRHVQKFVDRAEAVLSGFRYYHPRHAIEVVARQAQAAVQLTHQYGEGWLLAGEIGEFAKAGVRNIICLQPFGCIANHVIAKGVARRLKDAYPELNLLFLDLDAGLSEVNFLNRLHFFVEQARGSV